MADVKLKDQNGTEVTYDGINKVRIPSAAGEGQTVEFLDSANYRTAAEQSAIDATKQDKATTQTVTIAVADWSGGTTCTKNVTGVTASNIVFCDSSNSDVQCTAQGSGTLTFTATSTPTAVVTVKVVIL